MPSTLRPKRQGDEPLLLRSLDTPLGPMLAAASGRGVCLLEFCGGRTGRTRLEALARRMGGAPAPGGNEHLARLDRELARYFAGRLREFRVRLDLSGTPFQLRVWEALRRIPFGQTRSYGDVAREVGSPGAVRAVGSANAANRIAIVVPCHRVVNTGGALGGYAGGLRRKRRLLELERLPRT